MAGKSTLHRLERTTDGVDRYKKIRCDREAIDRLLVDVFVEAHREPPEEIILDIDATDTPLHGQQEGRFFHGYYGHYCYLPLYIFCGQHLLCARQRVSNQDAAAGVVEELERIVARVFTEFEYQTLQSWSRARRVVAKAEQLEGKENPRYVVTSLDGKSRPARQLPPRRG